MGKFGCQQNWTEVHATVLYLNGQVSETLDGATVNQTTGWTWWKIPAGPDIYIYMGVNPKIGGFYPKWMVKIMENPIKMDDLGVPLFSETPIFLTVNYMKGKVTSTVISPEKNGHPHIKTLTMQEMTRPPMIRAILHPLLWNSVIGPDKQTQTGKKHGKNSESLQNKRRLCTFSPFHGWCFLAIQQWPPHQRTIPFGTNTCNGHWCLLTTRHSRWLNLKICTVLNVSHEQKNTNSYFPWVILVVFHRYGDFHGLMK